MTKMDPLLFIESALMLTSDLAQKTLSLHRRSSLPLRVSNLDSKQQRTNIPDVSRHSSKSDVDVVNTNNSNVIVCRSFT